MYIDEETKKSTLKVMADFAKVLAVIITSTAVVGSAIIWFTLPRITEWVADVATSAVDQYVMQAETNAATLEGVTAQLRVLVDRIDELQRDPRNINEPALEFEDWGYEVSDARAGDRVSITWRFRKLHQCGAPIVNVFFRNGGDVTHRFENVSIVNDDGEGVDYPVDPDTIQTLTYSAVIPDDQDVEPGRAYAWVTLRYAQCPWAPPSISPEVPFNILRPPQ